MTEETTYDVLAVGDAVIDTLVKADESFLKQLKLEKNTVTHIDETKAKALFSYLDALKSESGDLPFESLKVMSGGSAANTAAGLASFGANIGYIGRVFADSDGKRFFDKLEGRGIECLTPPSVNGDHTGRSLVITTSDGARTMCTFVGTKTQEEDIDEDAIKRSKMVFFPAFMMDSAEGKQAIKALLAQCKTHQVKIAMSLSDPDCVKRHQQDLVQYVGADIDILFANQQEISALVGVADYEAAAKAIKALCVKRPFTAVVTLGAEGADIISADNDTLRVAAGKVDQLVDKTGAGALFASGFLYGISNDMPLEKCAKLGNLAAAEGLKTFGARPVTDLSTLL